MMRYFRKRRFSPGSGPNIYRPLPAALFFCVLLPALYFLSGTAISAMDLSDEPMLAKIKAAPANIMIVLDDSGSMTFEILIQGQYDGRFPNPRFEQPDEDGFCYIFDYLGDNAYAYDPGQDRWNDRDNRRYMLEDSRIY